MAAASILTRSHQRGIAETKVAGATNSNVENLWETMLRDAMRRNRLPDGTLLLVGPQGCGKSALLDTFLEEYAASANPSGGAAAAAAAPAVVTQLAEKGPEGATGAAAAGAAATSAAGVGGDNTSAANARGFHPVLAYSYLDATDPSEQGSERDDSPPRVSVWCCSELEFQGLLQTVLRPEQLANTTVAVTVDLSRPWEAMDSLEKWTAVVEKHIKGLLDQLSLGAQDDLRGAIKERLMAARAGAEKIGGDGGGGRLVGEGNESSAGGLGDGVLEKNLGVPLVVVGCKADSLQSETFEQQQRLHFIQQSLRRFCLKYGAALVYTSAKDGVNCGLLRRYLLSCLYPDAFRCSEEGQTSDAAFIPAGWDSKRLIDGLLSPEKTPWGPQATFSEVVIPPPEVARRAREGNNDDSWGNGAAAAGEEEAGEAVEPEEAWLSSLSKQVAGLRWQNAKKAALKTASESKSPRGISSKDPDPRSFFASLLASGSVSSVASPPVSGAALR